MQLAGSESELSFLVLDSSLPLSPAQFRSFLLQKSRLVMVIMLAEEEEREREREREEERESH